MKSIFFSGITTNTQKLEFISSTIKKGFKKLISNIKITLIFITIIVSEIIGWFILRDTINNLDELDRILNSIWILVAPLAFVIIDLFFIVSLDRPCLKLKYIKAFNSAGLHNNAEQPPELIEIKNINDDEYGICSKMTLQTYGISLETFKDKKAEIETAIKRKIIYMNQGKKVDEIELITISPNSVIPTYIEWDDSIIPEDDSKYILGQSYAGRLIIKDVEKEPHWLIAGASGSGKTTELLTIIRQGYMRGTIVYLIDLKRGIDFDEEVQKHVTMVTSEKDAEKVLKQLVDDMFNRLETIAKVNGARNIRQYRELGYQMDRVLIVVDEMAQITIQKNVSKELKETIANINEYLSKLTQLGRAVGYNVVCSTQRPDQDAIPSQVRSNINVRICGKANENLSRVVFGDSRADELVPKNLRGRFLLDDDNNTLFQGYYIKPNKNV